MVARAVGNVAQTLEEEVMGKKEPTHKELQAIIAHRIFAEIDRAEVKHPMWPSDLAHQVLIVSEEMGEVQKAALEIIEARQRGAFAGPDSPPFVHLDEEMIQVAAMAIRYLHNRSTLAQIRERAEQE